MTIPEFVAKYVERARSREKRSRDAWTRVLKAKRACLADSDGECSAEDYCPQLADGEPAKSGRHCPYDKREDGA